MPRDHLMGYQPETDGLDGLGTALAWNENVRQLTRFYRSLSDVPCETPEQLAFRQGDHATPEMIRARDLDAAAERAIAKKTAEVQKASAPGLRDAIAAAYETDQQNQRIRNLMEERGLLQAQQNNDRQRFLLNPLAIGIAPIDPPWQAGRQVQAMPEGALIGQGVMLQRAPADAEYAEVTQAPPFLETCACAACVAMRMGKVEPGSQLARGLGETGPRAG